MGCAFLGQLDNALLGASPRAASVPSSGHRLRSISCYRRRKSALFGGKWVKGEAADMRRQTVKRNSRECIW
jgi:hypothetical protein